MVQLSAIPERPAQTDGKAADDKEGRKKIHMELADSVGEFTTSVYGSKFAEEDLPTTQMPDDMMPRDIAYRLIKDDLSLDSNPKLK